MSVITPVSEEQQRLPGTILSELTIILDENVPLPRRIALLIKWYSVFEAITDGRVTVPNADELTPSRVRELAMNLAKLVARHLFPPRGSQLVQSALGGQQW